MINVLVRRFCIQWSPSRDPLGNCDTDLWLKIMKPGLIWGNKIQTAWWNNNEDWTNHSVLKKDILSRLITTCDTHTHTQKTVQWDVNLSTSTFYTSRNAVTTNNLQVVLQSLEITQKRCVCSNLWGHFRSEGINRRLYLELVACDVSGKESSMPNGWDNTVTQSFLAQVLWLGKITICVGQYVLNLVLKLSLIFYLAFELLPRTVTIIPKHFPLWIFQNCKRKRRRRLAPILWD